MAVVAISPPRDIGDVKNEIDQVDSKPVLTPPTSEGSRKKYDEDSDSELSDLEPEESVEEPALEDQIKEEEQEEEEAEIVPDHYYEGGKVPVFKPVSITALVCRLIDRSVRD